MATSVNELRLYYQNVRSIVGKIREFKINLLVSDYDFILLTETWLYPAIANAEIFDDRYTVHRYDRPTRAGGVLLALKHKYCPVGVPELEGSLAETVWVRVRVFNELYYFCVLYIPPNSQVTVYESFFDLTTNFLLDSGAKIIIAGDFNATDLTNIVADSVLATGGQRPRAYINFLSALQLTQHNCVKNHNGVCLDFVLTNCNVTTTKSDFPLVPVDMHHPPLSVEIPFLKRDRAGHRGTFDIGQLNFSKANFFKLYSNVRDLSWDRLYSVADVDDAAQIFNEILRGAFTGAVPYSIKSRRSYPPWFNAEIIKNLRLKSKKRTMFKKTGNQIFHVQFCHLRAVTKKLIDASYREYIRDMEANLSRDPEIFFAFIKKIKNCKATSRSPEDMTIAGEIITNRDEVQAAFASYFRSVYARNPSSYNTDFEGRVSVPYSFGFSKCTRLEIEAAINHLKPKRSRGPDSVPPYVFKACSEFLISPLEYIFNLIIAKSYFPAAWKLTKVCPIHKNGDVKAIENYRPIAMLSTPCKILETILHAQIYSHIRPFISPYQHGFLPKRSTVTNLLELSTSLSEAINSNSQVDVIYTDFAKAFDKVDHSVLLGKLHGLGFSRRALDLVASYLGGRRQYVVFAGRESPPFPVFSGVPQGSNLGPLLFTLLINDLPACLRYSKALLYADDCKIFRRISSIRDCNDLQNDLDELHQWAVRNLLEFNTSKCSVVSFSRCRQLITYNYSIANCRLTRDTTVRDLGVLFDARLTFIPHIDGILGKANSMLGFVLRNSSSFTHEATFLRLFHVYVRTILEYAAVVWSPFYPTTSNLLERVQKRFLRYMHFKRTGHYSFNVNYAALLSSFDMQPLGVRREAAGLLLFYKLLNGMVDSSFLLSQITLRVPSRVTRQADIFHQPCQRTNLALNAPMYRMSALANAHCDLDLFNISLTSLRTYLRGLTAGAGTGALTR